MTLKKTVRAALCCLAAALSAAALWRHFALAPIPALPLLFIGSLLLFAGARKLKDRRTVFAAGLLGGFFALCCVLARTYLVDGGSVLWALLRFVGLFLCFSMLLARAFSFLAGFSVLLDESAVRDVSGRRLALVFLGAFALLYLWFMLWLLYRFPGCMSPDSTWQLLQANGTMPLSNHHPVVHTLLIRLFTNIGYLIGGGSHNIAIAVYSVVQAGVLALAFAYFTVSIYAMRVKVPVIAAIFASFFILPYHGSSSVTMLKDVWFGAIVLTLCLSLWRLIVSLGSGGGKASARDIVLLSICSLGMCLFRTNGLYAFVLLLPFLFILFFRRCRTAALLPLLALAAALFIRGPLYTSLGIIPPDTIESLSIPAQHIARAISEGAELEEEQLELLENVMDVSAVPDFYLAHLSDPIKDLVRRTGDQEYLASHKADFMKLWLQLGLRYPGAYLRAHIDLTDGYWYPRTDGIVMYPYFTSDASEGLCLLPGPVASLLHGMANYMPRIPLLSLFFSNGAAVWLYLAIFALCAAKKHYRQLAVLVPALAVWATLLIATPLNNEFRYAYCFFTTLPLAILLPFFPVNCHKSK